ncbi:MAG: phosphatidylglycerophosphatase A [Synergistaceae bacterium]|jgi:phosphatidylglycerophosphatase A|nr:phosphatidylglycerophosphatase A [Synergistaceae bacterium]
MKFFGKRELTWYGAVSTMWGLGYVSKSPGTLGCVVSFVFFLLAENVSVLLILFLIAIGIIAVGRYMKTSADETPGGIIVDEAVGLLAALWGMERDFAIVGFFLYRIVDIVKPFPSRHIVKLPRGVGIMADDIWCGAVTNILLRLSEWFFFKDGMEAVFRFLNLEA